MLVFSASLPVFSQVEPAATESGLPLSVGAGVSDFYTEMISKHLQGPTVWADWNFYRGSSFLRGFGAEAEVRVLDFGEPPGQRLRLANAGGGPIYTWRHFCNIRPYGKFLVDFSGMDHIKISTLPRWYTADRWATYAVGGGVEYRAVGNVWIRADYEYQFWRVEFFNPNAFLNPQGFTVGASYNFRHVRAHEQRPR
jgi:hypothetical protein